MVSSSEGKAEGLNIANALSRLLPLHIEEML